VSDVIINLSRSMIIRHTIFGTSTICRRRVTGFLEVTSAGLESIVVEPKAKNQKHKRLTHSYSAVSQCRSWACCSIRAYVHSVCFPCSGPNLAPVLTLTLNFRLQSHSSFLQHELWREPAAHVAEPRVVTKPSLEGGIRYSSPHTSFALLSCTVSCRGAR
jgi:hypothetical protein